MLILTIRTDKPSAEIGLYKDNERLAYEVWEANRELAETIHEKIRALLAGQSKDFGNIEGVVCFEGPGSFTGLRIGLSVGNALAYGLGIPIVGAQDDDWIVRGVQRLLAKDTDEIVLPFYGADAHITLPKR